jgi:hypothetical protein
MQRKQYSAQFKAKIALEAVKGLKTKLRAILSGFGLLQKRNAFYFLLFRQFC